MGRQPRELSPRDFLGLAHVRIPLNQGAISKTLALTVGVASPSHCTAGPSKRMSRQIWCGSGTMHANTWHNFNSRRRVPARTPTALRSVRRYANLRTDGNLIYPTQRHRGLTATGNERGGMVLPKRWETEPKSHLPCVSWMSLSN